MPNSHAHTHMAFVLTTIQLVVKAMTFSAALTSALNVGNTAMSSNSVNNARVPQDSMDSLGHSLPLALRTP